MLAFVLAFLLHYPLFRFYLAKESRFPVAFKLVRYFSWLMRFLSGIVLVVKRKAPMPKAPFIICSNHSSYLDIIILYGVFSEYFIFMGKSEINSWPLFHIFFTKGMNISVNRGSLVDAHKAMKRSAGALDKGQSLVIFPEATIPPGAPTMKRFKNGAFKLALEKGVPIVPVTFLNNFKRLQVGAFFKVMGGPGISRVIIHPPVETKDLGEEDLVNLRTEIFEVINRPLQELYGSK